MKSIVAFLPCIFLVATTLHTIAADEEPNATPSRIVDSHHHFLDLMDNGFSSWLGGLFGPFQYFPEQYTADVVDPLADTQTALSGSVHVEVLPDAPFGGVEETTWVQSLVDDGRAPYVKAIVGSCDLGDAENVAECLSQIDSASPLMRGIRWILDYVGPFDGNSATHVNAARKDIDYLRGGEGGTVTPEFEEGFAMLSQYDFSFDAQLAPEQLPAMAELASRYPEVPVCLNHVGKPRLVLGPYSNATEPDEFVLTEWKEGMKLMAAQPHVYVKLGMLGYMVPDWILDPKREAVVKDLVIETIEMFGAKRCMFELNWYLGASISDNDGLGTVGPSPVELVGYMSDWLADYSQEDREWIFAKTAESFYKFEDEKNNIIEDDENIDRDDANEDGGSSDAFSYYCHGSGAAFAFIALVSIGFMW